MFVKLVTDRNRNDFWYTGECEHCGHERKNMSGYNDAYYHEQVVPSLRCASCGLNRAGEKKMDDRINSTSDSRTANNDVRHQYRVLSDLEKKQMVELKDLGLAFLNKCDEVGQSRELSLAKTNAEQAVMWAVKHVTR